MARRIFINLPVRDLQRSVGFFTALGFGFDPRFTDDNATCMVVSTDILVMLLVEPFFQGFTPKPVADAHACTEVLLALSFDRRQDVDAFVDAALAAGARENRPKQDLGFMYQRSFADLDGHQWEPFFMDEGAVPAAA